MFSFGVIVLEILTGRRNTSPPSAEDEDGSGGGQNLLSYVSTLPAGTARRSDRMKKLFLSGRRKSLYLQAVATPCLRYIPLSYACRCGSSGGADRWRTWWMRRWPGRAVRADRGAGMCPGRAAVRAGGPEVQARRLGGRAHARQPVGDPPETLQAGVLRRVQRRRWHLFWRKWSRAQAESFGERRDDFGARAAVAAAQFGSLAIRTPISVRKVVAKLFQ
jgi:hypothetical protein